MSTYFVAAFRLKEGGTALVARQVGLLFTRAEKEHADRRGEQRDLSNHSLGAGS